MSGTSSRWRTDSKSNVERVVWCLEYIYECRIQLFLAECRSQDSVAS